MKKQRQYQSKQSELTMEEAEMVSDLSSYKQSTTENLTSLNKEENLLASIYCVLTLRDWVDMNLSAVKESSFHHS